MGLQLYALAVNSWKAGNLICLWPWPQHRAECTVGAWERQADRGSKRLHEANGVNVPASEVQDGETKALWEASHKGTLLSRPPLAIPPHAAVCSASCDFSCTSPTFCFSFLFIFCFCLFLGHSPLFLLYPASTHCPYPSL